MSFMPAWVGMLNQVFGPDNIREIDVEDLPGWDVSLREGLSTLGIPESSAEEVLAQIPEAHVFALRGLLESAVRRNLPIHFSWMPGYDNELTICEWADQPDDPCGITVLVRSRHVSDLRRGSAS